jgi:hypothetical protein
MITEDIKRLENYGFDIEEKPTGYVFTMNKGDKNKEENIFIRKEACELIQKIGKIEELHVIGGTRVRIVVLRAIIGTG